LLVIADHSIVIKDELETAMQMIGITRLEQAHPGLLNTGELDGMVYKQTEHPWARKIVRRAKL
jgi:L-lactate dehydrogenase (cytochrome)